MDFLIGKLEEDIEYLYSQGKRIDMIKMNPEIYEHFIQSRQDVPNMDIPVEADENVEKYELVYSVIQ